MSPWFKMLEGKPDHPMSDVGEVRKLLANLPENDPLKALDEITEWLGSVKDTPDFRPELRTNIVMLLDETGQPFQQALLQQYLAESHLQDFQGMRLWQGMHGYMKALVEAYALCIDEYQKEGKESPAFKGKISIICVRLLHAIAGQMKLELMRYINVEQAIWEQLYKYYNFAVANQLADSVVYAYSRRSAHTSPQRELLRAALLYAASPATLAPDQIEVSYHIAARLSSYFDFKEAADPDCIYFLDLAKSAAPQEVNDKLQITPTMRFFGAARAVPKLEEIINESEREQNDEDQRLDKDFTPHGKLTVLKHLQIYWGKDHPHRRQERRGIHTSIEVIHGFQIIGKLVTRAELDQIGSLTEEEMAMLKEQSKINLTEVEDGINYVTETWEVLDVSLGGIGGRIPKTAGDWVKIGALAASRP